MAFNLELFDSPKGYNTEWLVERLRHVRDLVDLDSWRVILDIGACDGWEGVNFARLFPDARVYSFEPSPDNHRRCDFTYTLQPPDVTDRVTLVKAALAEVTGPITFHAVDEERARAFGNVNFGMGSLLEIVDPRILPWENSVQRGVEVQGYRLDEWCDEAGVDRVDALWVDVQGAELHVFRGAERKLQDVQVIMTEAGLRPYYHGHTMKPEIDQWLADRGFVEVESARQMHDQGLEVNAIYVNQRFLQKST